MPKHKLPWFEFYPGDWMKDPDLRRCSRAARGMWIDMICLMFEAENRGILASNNVPWTDREIAAAVGGDIAEGCELIAELLRTGAASRSTSGAVVCRRLIRDEELRRVRAESGSKGGSKTQAKRKANRNQIPDGDDEDEDSFPGNGGAGGKGASDPPGFLRFWAAWPTHPRKAERKQCVEKWRTMSCEPLADVIVASVEAHKTRHPDWLREDRDCIPAPLVWLNKGRWEAVLPEVVSDKKQKWKEALAKAGQNP